MGMNPPPVSPAEPSAGTELSRVLLFNIPRGTLDPGTSFLAREPFMEETCASAEDLLQRIDKTPYKMIILNLPTAGFEPRDIVYALRQERHASSQAILVVLCPEEKLAEYQPYLAKGVSALFPLSAPAANLETALASILQVAPRVATRIMVRLTAKVHQQTSKHLCQALNISKTGMLVSTTLHLPPGTEVSFELMLPGHPAPILGDARVARHSRGVGASSTGLGMSFKAFKQDGRTRVNAFIDGAPAKK